MYRFRCKKCEKTEMTILPMSSCRDESQYPICCEEPMTKLLDSAAFKFECSPHGHYYPTVGKTCGTEAEYQREADKTRKKMEKDYNSQ